MNIDALRWDNSKHMQFWQMGSSDSAMYLQSPSDSRSRRPRSCCVSASARLGQPRSRGQRKQTFKNQQRLTSAEKARTSPTRAFLKAQATALLLAAYFTRHRQSAQRNYQRLQLPLLLNGTVKENSLI